MTSDSVELQATPTKVLAAAIEHHRHGNLYAAYDGYQIALARYPRLAASIQLNLQILKNRSGLPDPKWSYDAEVRSVPSKPADFPDWLQLPPLQGVANDYTLIEQARDHWIKTHAGNYHLPVSVIIPVYNRSRELEFVLAGLIHQTYPPHLIEVVIADDGSQEDIPAVVDRFASQLNIKYCRQSDQGYRLAKVRNLGIHAASHDSLVILDSDAIPCRSLLESYLQFLHVRRDVALFGLRHYVDVSCLDAAAYRCDPHLIQQARPVQSENTVATKVDNSGCSVDWRVQTLQSTDNLKQEPLPYRLLVGANCAFSRELYEAVGGYCEDFCDWGYEDQEFGYRLFLQGAYFIPVAGSLVYHQEPVAGKNDTDRLLGEAKTRPLFIQKCPFVVREKIPDESGYEAPLVSIYIPLYNRKEYIVPCIHSALAQTIRDLEVVVADDGSTDGSRELVERHFGDDPRVRLYTQSNAGIAAASTLAVSHARGCYIGQLDADDLLMRDAVEICLKEMTSNHKLSLVYGTTEYIDSTGARISPGWNWPQFSREHLLSNMIVHHFRFFRARDFRRTSGFDRSLVNAVDYDMMLKLSEVGEVEHVNKVLYQYRKHGESTTAQRSRAQIQNHFRCINKALARMGLTHVMAVPAVEDPDSRSRTVRFTQSLTV